jgi:Fe-S-cluster containining protein
MEIIELILSSQVNGTGTTIILFVKRRENYCCIGKGNSNYGVSYGSTIVKRIELVLLSETRCKQNSKIELVLL